MAVLGLLFGAQFCESFLDRGKIKERVIAKSVRSARDIQEHAFRLTAEHSQRLPIAGRCDDTHKPAAALFRGDFSKLPNQPGIVGLIVGIVPDQVRLVRGVTGGMDSRSTAQSIHFESRIVREHDFAGRVTAVAFGFLARIGLEGQTVFDDGGD